MMSGLNEAVRISPASASGVPVTANPSARSAFSQLLRSRVSGSISSARGARCASGVGPLSGIGSPIVGFFVCPPRALSTPPSGRRADAEHMFVPGGSPPTVPSLASTSGFRTFLPRSTRLGCGSTALGVWGPAPGAPGCSLGGRRDGKTRTMPVEVDGAPGSASRGGGDEAGDAMASRGAGGMRFGLLCTASVDTARSISDYVDFNVAAEALGFVSSFLVEHHFSGWNQVAATLLLQTCVATRTSSLRVGTGVMVLPWHNPVLLAEQAATLDVISGGRVDLGVGKGYRHSEFRGFNVDQRDADPRFEEALDVLVRAWTTRRAVLTSRPVLDLRRHRRRAATGSVSLPADLGRRRQ